MTKSLVSRICLISKNFLHSTWALVFFLCLGNLILRIHRTNLEYLWWYLICNKPLLLHFPPTLPQQSPSPSHERGAPEYHLNFWWSTWGEMWVNDEAASPVVLRDYLIEQVTQLITQFSWWVFQLAWDLSNNPPPHHTTPHQYHWFIKPL